ALQVQQLGDNQVRDLVIDCCPEKDDPFAQEERVDVEGALAAGAGLDNGWDDHVVCPLCPLCLLSRPLILLLLLPPRLTSLPRARWIRPSSSFSRAAFSWVPTTLLAYRHSRPASRSR